jgi:hypothetical protein
MPRCFVAALAVVCLLIPGVASGDDPSIEAPISPRVELKASIAPRALAKSKPTPISLRASTSVSAENGSHPPALKEFELEVDRHARLNLGGIPACHSGGRETVRKACREALVGKGVIDIGIQFPETTTPDQHEEVFIYNGETEKGARKLFLWSEISIPRPTAIVIPVTIKADRGRFGLKAVGSVPKIAGGSGWIDRLELRFHRGIFSATYPRDGTFDLRESTVFVDGTRLVSSVSLPTTSLR